MSYTELFQKLFSFPGRKGTTFAAMQRLDETLNFPHRYFRSIHVGGTNGKGSVALKVARSLQEEGYRVGLYTSPHISDFRERICVNGEMISERDAAILLDRLFHLIREDLSFFDLLTAMAFLYFKKQNVDWAVIEVGLGGRLDATNVISPEIAVITSIGYDHTQILGNSLAEIAREKEAIAKPGIPLIVGPQASPFFPKAMTVKAEKFYDIENQAIARAVLKKIEISEISILAGLSVRPPCRFEVRENVILDAAHNPDGFKKLIDALGIYFPKKKFHFMIAFSHDKDWRGCLDLIRPLANRITAVCKEHEKLVSPELLKFYASEIEIAPLILSNYLGITVVCGSFYIMEEARCEIQRKEGERGLLSHR